MSIKNLALLFALLSPPAVAGGSSLILDDFDADPNDDAGGPREVNFTTYDDPFNQGGNFNVDTSSTFGSDVGAAILGSGAGAEQQVEFVWNNAGTGLSIDADGAGITGFELDFAFVDQDFTAAIRLNTFESPGGTTYALEWFDVAASYTAQTVSISFADFDSFGDGFLLSDVDQITLTLNRNRSGTPALNFILTEFRAVVPAPGPAALLGFAGLAMTRRRR